MKRLALLVAGLLLSAPAFAAEGCDPGETRIKFSHVVAPKGNPKGEAAAEFATRVNAEMNGKVCVEVYPNSQLFDDDKVLEAMILGDVQLAAPSLSKFEQYTLVFRLFDLPFIFDDIAAVDRFQKSADGQKMLGSMRDKGLIGLGFWHNGLKQLSANRPLLLPADARGLKFRIQPSDVLQAQFEALGAVPQKLAFSEVYGALQTGVVDGQENTYSNIFTQKFFEVQDGITETNHGVLDYLLVTSAEFWDGLEADVRDQLGRILIEVTDKWNGKAGEVNDAAKARIVAAGTVIRTLDATRREAWKAAMKPVWARFQDQIGEDVIDAALASSKGS